MFTIVRGLTLAFRLLIILSLPILLQPQDVGLYGLIVTVITALAFFSGWELYTYYERRKAIQKNPRKVVSYHIASITTFFTILSPIWILLVYFSFREVSSYLFLMFILVYFELLVSEITRNLNFLGYRLDAAVILLLKSSSWVVVLIILYQLLSIDLLLVLLLWLAGCFVALVYSFYILFNRKLIFLVREFRLSVLYKTLKYAFPLVITALFGKAFFWIDKLIPGYFGDYTNLGVYVVMTSLVLGVFSIIDIFVFTRYYPSLIINGRRGDYASYRVFFRFAILMVVFLGPLVYLPLNIIVFLLYPNLLELGQVLIFFVILNAVIFYLSYIPHYFLYSLKFESKILLSNVLGIVTFLLLIYIWETYKVEQLVVSMCVGLIVSFVVKVYFVPKRVWFECFKKG